MLNYEQILVNNEQILVNNEQILVNNEQILVNNEQILVNNEQILVNNEQILVNNEQILVNNEQILVNNEQILVNNEQILVSNEQILVSFLHLLSLKHHNSIIIDTYKTLFIMEKIQLPANLQLIRSVWGMNRKQIGLLVNCKAHQIGGYERGSVSATPSLLFMLEDLTGIAARRLYYEPLTRAILPTEPLRTTETTKNMTPQYLMPSASLEERVQRLEAKVFGTAKK